MHQTWQTWLVSETQDSSLKIELTWKNLKSRNPSQTTVAMPQVPASHCCTKVVTNSLTTTTNEIVTTSKRLETASHGVETSKKWWLLSPTESQRIVLPSPNFQHAENLQANATDNFGVCGRYRILQRLLTATHDDWRQIQNCNS